MAEGGPEHVCVHRRVICAQGVAHMCTQVMCAQGVAHVCAQVVCAQEGGVHTGGGTHLCTGGVCAHGWHTCAHRWPCARREEPALAIGSFPGRLCRFSPAATWPLLQSVCLPSVPGLPPPLWGPRQWCGTGRQSLSSGSSQMHKGPVHG